MKKIMIGILVLLFILISLYFFDKDKSDLNVVFDTNYNEEENGIFFYRYNNKIYYLDSHVNDGSSNSAIYKYSIETDPRAYIDFRDYYLFKNTLLISGTYIGKYICQTDKCFVISRDSESSMMDMNSYVIDNIKIMDGFIIDYYLE